MEDGCVGAVFIAIIIIYGGQGKKQYTNHLVFWLNDHQKKIFTL